MCSQLAEQLGYRPSTANQVATLTRSVTYRLVAVQFSSVHVL